MKKILIALLAFCLTTFMCVSCASIPEEQKADTYEAEAYVVWPSTENIYYYVIYEKDVSLAKETAKPVFVDKWFERTDNAGVYFLYTTSNKEVAYTETINLEKNYELGTNSSGPKKYRIGTEDVPSEFDPVVKIIKNIFRAGRNDRLFVVKLMLDVKEKHEDRTFTYDVVTLMLDSKSNKRFRNFYTNDESCFNLGKYYESKGLPFHAETLR